ncbi:hypothetical protein T02_1335 [Trichinella nativa]|uniref:Uncharacterized protein n=1 Tax=Trichinella nativa TaxID=6335 RepID=A0A0V1LEE6_9BILA|nr:hypothetical protein T02_1335 [Trichinella nativa]
MFLGKSDADSQRVHLSRNNTSYIIEAFSQYRLIYNFNIPVFSNMNITAKRKCRMPTLNLMNQNVKTCMGKSFQYFFRILFHHYPILNVMTLLGSSSCSYSSASNISSVPLMKKEFSHPLMEFQNSVEQPSGSNRTMNAKYGKDPCEKYIDILILLKKLLNRKVDYEKMIEVYAKQKSPAIYFESSRIATNQLRSLIINASMHALNVQLKALRIGAVQVGSGKVEEDH